MATGTKAISAGFELVFYSLLDSEGYATGGTGTVTAGDANGSPALRINGAKTIPIAAAEAEFVPVTGDDEVIGQFSFAPATLPSGVLEVAVRDLELMARAQGTLVRDVGGTDGFQYTALQPADLLFQDMSLILQSRAQSQTAGIVGAARKDVEIVPLCQLTPLGGERTERAAKSMRYSINASPSDKAPWGMTFTEALDGTTKMPIMSGFAANGVHLHAFKGDASRVAFTLAYTPAATSKVYVYVEGVQQAYTTNFTVSGKVITFGVAPASGARIEVFYEFSSLS